MKLRVEASVATPTWDIPVGRVIEVARLTPELQEWLEKGILSVVRDPDVDLETPERPDHRVECAGHTAAAPDGVPAADKRRKGGKTAAPAKAAVDDAASVPRLAVGGTVICLACGPSLTPSDVDVCRGQGVVIAVNDAYRLAPWADVLYACDEKWWRWHELVPSFAGLKFALEPWRNEKVPGITVLKNTGHVGLERSLTGLRTGHNSGYQAINLAVNMGARRVLLLGYDMQTLPGKPSHFFGEHPDKVRPPAETFVPFYDQLAPLLEKIGVEVINCSAETALTCFRRQALSTALEVKAA